MIRKAKIRSKITPSGESEVLVLLPGQNFGCTVKGPPWRTHQRGMWSYQMWSHIGSEWMQLRIYHEFPISSVIILSKNRGPKPALAVEFRGMFLMIKWESLRWPCISMFTEWDPEYQWGCKSHKSIWHLKDMQRKTLHKLLLHATKVYKEVRRLRSQ